MNNLKLLQSVITFIYDSTSAGFPLPLPDAALSSSLIINTRLDSPAAEKASMMIPGFAFA